MKIGKAGNIFMVLLLVLLSACADQSQGTVCFKPNGAVTQSDGKTTDKNTETLQSITDYLKEKKIISTIVDKIRTDLFGTTGNGGKAAEMFTAISSDPEFQNAISAAFILFVTFYGLGVAGGYVQASIGDAAIKVSKIGFISVMAFSWGEFYSLIGTFFMDGRDELMAYLMQGFEGVAQQNAGAATGLTSLTTDAIFGVMDDLVAKVFSPHMLAILAALFDFFGQNSGPYAIGYALVLFTGLSSLFMSVITVVSVYVFSLFANVVLFAVAPIYLTFLLFDRTKPLFDSWVKQLVNYNLQPILASLFLALFMQVMGPFLDEILNVTVVNDTNGVSSQGKASGWRFADTNCNSNSFGNQSAPPISLQTLLLFVFFSWCFKAYIGITGAISIALTGAVGNLSEIGKQMMGQLQQSLGSIGGKK